jgi:uncharacterized protein (DUF302 family)
MSARLPCKAHAKKSSKNHRQAVNKPKTQMQQSKKQESEEQQ